MAQRDGCSVAPVVTDREIFSRLLAAVAALEATELWPPGESLVRAFEGALDGATRRFLHDPYASSDGYISRELIKVGDGIFTAGDLWVLNAGGESLTRRAEARLSSSVGGWIHVCSEQEQQQFQALTRRQRAAATHLDRWAYTVVVPDPAALSGPATSE